LRAFESWVQRRIFGPKREEVMEGWLKLHNEDVRIFSLHQILEKSIQGL
jgi:hypothetical protein